MYDRILVALDGSETSEQALQHAIRLASEQRAKLRLLHVVDELGVNLGQTPTPDAFWIAARKAGDRILEQANARVATVGLEAETKLLEMRTFGAVVRRVADLIVEEAQRWPADLIVVGTHGRRGLSKILLGSVAEGVIRLSSLPVLLIRGPDTDSR
jgi:nucleotide-binding universal stress UspA family protein